MRNYAKLCDDYAILCDDYAIQQFSYGLTHNYAIKFLMTKHHRIIYYAILCDIMRYYADRIMRLT